jgi:hypothetical protein
VKQEAAVGEVTAVGGIVVAVEDILEEVIEEEVLVIAVAIGVEPLVGIAEAVLQYTVDMAIAVPDALATVEDPGGTTIEDMHQEGPYTELL